MNKTRATLLACIAVVLASLAMLPPAQAARLQARLAAVESDAAKADEGPTTVVGTAADPGYPPFETLKNGKIVGFDVDLVKAIGNRAGFKAKFQSFPFAALVTPPGVWASCGMVAAALTPTGDGEQFMDFSDLYFDSAPYGPLAFAFPKGSALREVVNAALQQVKDDGTYDRIYKAWFGGRGWLAQSSGTTMALFDVCSSDATHAWAVGEAGTILATTDGGDTWSAQGSGSSADLHGVAFSDAAHGWVVGDGGTILATTDGGVTWSVQTPGSSATLEDVACSDATHGWAVGFGGTILATIDGGATWTKQSSGTTEWLWGVACGDATHGWAVGFGGTILATTDGGATWTKQSSGTTEDLWAVAFSDATHGWAVGGDILATTNGGSTWSARSSGSDVRLTAVTFIDATHGWAVGEDGIILATTDGGANWSAQSSGGAAWLTAVAFSDATHGWAVGGTLLDEATATATILATTTGGVYPVPAAPSIAKLKPATGKRGTTVTVSGTDFGAARGAGSVKFGATKCTKYVSWSDTQIKCRVPAQAKYGAVKVTVTTTAGTSDALSFKVKR